MKKKLIKVFGQVFAVSVMMASMGGLVSCNPEPDESDMYTSTGETAEDYISRKPELTSFNYILKRVGLDRNLSSYGEYTCFAPTNEAVAEYINDLYNDESAIVPHNSMTENSLEGLSDSLCNDIALYHLATGVTNSVELGSGSTVRTMLGRTFGSKISEKFQGQVALEETAVIIQPDTVVTNGIVHVIDKVIPRSNRLISDELERMEEYSIFMEALKRTHLVDSMLLAKKPVTYDLPDAESEDNGSNAGKRCYWPKECEIKYTIFAEPNAVMIPALTKAGFSGDIDGLIAYANSIYANADEWYDQLAEKGLWSETQKAYVNKVSTGTDYESRNNALNMFVAYHILYAGMPANELVWEYSTRWSDTWNYVNETGPYDYYETMLPNTLMKIWQPTYMSNATYINRYIMNNTLSDRVGDKNYLGGEARGSEAMHAVVRQGVRVSRTSSDYPTNIQAYNGYIHAIQGMLVYDKLVPQGVLHERLRFDSTTFLVEFINNGIRMARSSEIAARSKDNHGARVAFPLNFFDNVVSYTKENRFRYNVKGGYNAWQGDTFQGWGNYDLAIKLPPLPSGPYEFRIFYTPMSHGGMMMFYLGNSSKLSSMVPMDIPLDVRISESDPRIGSTYYMDEEDLGVTTDAAMRNRGYMRGLYSYKDHVDREPVTDANCKTSLNQRSNQRNTSLRKIMSRSLDVKQSEEMWFRIKNVIPDETDLKWQFDYIEFVPLDIVGNTAYSEDWF